MYYNLKQVDRINYVIFTEKIEKLKTYIVHNYKKISFSLKNPCLYSDSQNNPDAVFEDQLVESVSEVPSDNDPKRYDRDDGFDDDIEVSEAEYTGEGENKWSVDRTQKKSSTQLKEIMHSISFGLLQ